MSKNLNQIKNVKIKSIKSKLDDSKEFVINYDHQNKPRLDVVFIEKDEGLKAKDYLRKAEKKFYKQLKGSGKKPFSKKKIIAIVAGAAVAIAAAVTLPCVLLTGEAIPEGAVTYELLWGTKIRKLDNHMVLTHPEGGIPTLYKVGDDGKISDKVKILYFTDLHLDHKKYACEYTYTMMAKNIMLFKPDLVLFCGDNITSIIEKPRARDFANMMEELGIYWSFVLGNHEGAEYPEKDMMPRSESVKFFDQFPHCLEDSSVKYTSDGKEVWGNGNHAFNILNSEGKVAQTFVFLDSGTVLSSEDQVKYEQETIEMEDMGKLALGASLYDYVKDSQIQWYKELMAKYPGSNSTVISHVPLKDMEDAYLDYHKDYKENGPTEIVGDWNIYHEQSYGPEIYMWPYTEVSVENGTTDKYGANKDIKILTGHRAEDMCYGPHDIDSMPEFGGDGHTPLFHAIHDSGGTHPAFFCGHDHQNNFVYEQTFEGKQMTLGYIQPACYSSNNFWTKGMLTDDPVANKDKYHLIQGCTVMNYDLMNFENPFTVKHHTNYESWDGEHYYEILQIIPMYRSSPDYKPARNKYINDPNDPLREE